MSALVDKLSQGEHAVALIRYKSVDEVRQAIDRGFVLVKFMDTQGGTELGVSLDKSMQAFDPTSGTVDLSGTLTLDYRPVRCTVNVDLATLAGRGALQPA